jgi:hypothetical protein
MMIVVDSSGDFKKTEQFLSKMAKADFFNLLERYGQMGVDALADASPVDSGILANSWDYEVVRKRGEYAIIWHNTNIENGMPVAILVQYGHGTGTGGWVEGRDYINPAIRPIFDQITDEVWRQVTNG